MSPLSLTQGKKNGFSFWPQSQLSLFVVLKHGTQRQELWPAEAWTVVGGSRTREGGWARRRRLGMRLCTALPARDLHVQACYWQAGRQASKTPLEALLSLGSLSVKITALPQPESSEVTDTDKVVCILSPGHISFSTVLTLRTIPADENLGEMMALTVTLNL